MRIGIDIHTITGLMQGVRTYTFNIVDHLLRADSENEYFLYITEPNKKINTIFSQDNVTFKQIFPHSRIIRIPISFPVRLYLDSIDVFHCQYMGPPLAKTPYVVTLHDIIHEYLPELYPKTLRYFMSLLYPLSAKRASRILTVSESSKRDIVKYFKVPEEKVVVTYNGVSEKFHQITEREKIKWVLKKHGVMDEYILFVGRLEPRKNISGLIKAFHDIKRNNKIKHKLVIVGMNYFRYKEIFNVVNNLGLQDEIIFTGRVEDDDLPMFYNGASLFVYPAFAEGFGLPPLEAMACGTPVISSNTSSLPEVIGDAGILIDPYNTQGLARAIYEVLSDKNLQERLKIKGLKRSKKFSWDNSAKKTLEVFSDIYKKNN